MDWAHSFASAFRIQKTEWQLREGTENQGITVYTKCNCMWKNKSIGIELNWIRKLAGTNTAKPSATLYWLPYPIHEVDPKDLTQTNTLQENKSPKRKRVILVPYFHSTYAIHIVSSPLIFVSLLWDLYHVCFYTPYRIIICCVDKKHSESIRRNRFCFWWLIREQ